MLHDSRDVSRFRQLATYPLTVVGILLALSVELMLSRTPAPLSLTPFSLAVALSAWYGGFGPGMLALVLSAFCIDFFLIEPDTLLSFGRQQLDLAIYIVGWLTFCLLAGQGYRSRRQDRDARTEAERVARQADRLAQLTAALGQARTPAAVIEASVQEPLHALNADAGIFLLIGSDGTTADLARAVACHPEDIERWQQVSLTEKTPESDAIGRGAPVLVESRARWIAEYGEPPADRYSPDCQAIITVPLVIGSHVVAVVRLDFRRARTFTADDREYLFSLGPRASQALDRTWQYEYAQRARIEAESLRARADQELTERQKIERALRASEARYRALAARTSRLHGLTAGLSEAVTLDAVAQAVVHQGKIAVGAITGEVTLLVENGTQFERLYADGVEPRAARRFAVESGLCATQAVQSGRPVFVGSFAEWQERFWRSASLAADGGYVSTATLPLMVEGTAIGVLAFYFTAPVNFDEGYEALLNSVAQHCAQALDRARLYESAQHARTEAETANRLKDEFVSIVSHELRTPLNAILGWTTMLQRGILDPTVASRALQSVRDNATRQAKLVDELLDFSRLTGGRTRLDLEEIHVPDLIRGIVESMIPTAAAHGLDLQLAPVPPVRLTGDVRRLEQVFFNLLGNALKFTPTGGRITIETRIVDEFVEVRVSDTGAGIEPRFLPHVFDRFRQADSTTTRNHGGLGLGLSIVRQLVEAHQGTVGVESPGPGGGSTFIVRLPSTGEPVEPIEERPAAATGVEGPPECPAMTRLDGIRVLVVDDEADARDIVAHALQECGAEVMVAGTAHDAMGILEDREVDVLLADIAMPVEDGYSLIRKVRASGLRHVSSIPAAAVTAHAREDERTQALAAGFHLHLAKPFDPAQLAQAVERLVRGSSVVH